MPNLSLFDLSTKHIIFYIRLLCNAFPFYPFPYWSGSANKINFAIDFTVCVFRADSIFGGILTLRSFCKQLFSHTHIRQWVAETVIFLRHQEQQPHTVECLMLTLSLLFYACFRTHLPKEMETKPHTKKSVQTLYNDTTLPKFVVYLQAAVNVHGWCFLLLFGVVCLRCSDKKA